MRAIITTQIQFDELNAKVHQYCIDTIAGYKADKWCEEKIHPTDGRIAFAVEDKILGALTAAEKNGITELTNDWFPKSDL